MQAQNRCQLEGVPQLSEGVIPLGPMSPGKRIRLFVHRAFTPAQKRQIKRQISRGVALLARLSGPVSEEPTSLAVVTSGGKALEAGDWVRVRSEAEIRTTLDDFGQLKHCAFMPEMTVYCDTTQRVFKPVRRFLDERDYRVKKTQGLVLLDGVFCEGTAMFGQCDRGCFYFWREEWLERLDGPPAGEEG